MRHLLSSLVILFSLACSNPSRLEQALGFACENRSELEKVLEHYRKNPQDSLKYKAACFLIENMQYHYSDIKNPALYPQIDSLFSLGDKLTAEEYIHQYDSILLSPNLIHNKGTIPDLKKISSSILISNIDNAFAMYKYPWCARLPFKDFCEYVLPYKVRTEYPEDWRPLYIGAFSHPIDFMVGMGATDSIISEYIVNAYKYNNYDKSYTPALPPSILLKIKAGNCVDYSTIGVYFARAFGLPVTIDFTPIWANGSGRHQWDALLLPHDTSLPFMVGDNPPFGTHLKRAEMYANRKLAKVYRKTYSANPEALAMQQLDEEIPCLFKDPCFIDVSSLYFDAVDIPLNIETVIPSKKKIIYIMTFGGQKWVPVHWSKIEDNKVTFNKMAKNCMYIAMYYDNNNFHPVSNPFYIDSSGIIKKLKADRGTEKSAVLTRKYYPEVVNLRIRNIIGDKFQGANRSDFSDAEDLYTIDTLPEARFHSLYLNSGKKYKYLRYLASEKSTGNIAELEFFNNDNQKITGKIIGTDDSIALRGKDKNKGFDGNVLTFFETKKDAKGWIGLSLDKKENVKKIIYLPRNDDNFIRDKELYELFYWENKWKSLGQKTGDTAQIIVYNNIPSSSLLLLRNHTKGSEERIFTYENGKQVWW